MLGPPKLRLLDQPVTVSLEELVPGDNFYRHLDAKLDLSFVRAWVADCYADRGRPSIDPVVFFKLQLVLFFEGLRSERKLMETVQLNLAHRWYLGYRLDECLPDHSSLTRIRERLGLSLFQRFFAHVVELCREAGLIWGKELIFDATEVRANADVDSLQLRWYLEAKAHLGDLFTGDTPAHEDRPSTAPAEPPAGDAPPAAPVAARCAEDRVAEAGVPVGLPVRASPEDQQRLADHNQTTWRLLDHLRLDPERPTRHRYERLMAQRVGTTDPDAALMSTGQGAVLGYHDHYVVDGGKARIILAALVTPADVMENTPMLDLLHRVRFRWQLHPQRAVGRLVIGADGMNSLVARQVGAPAYHAKPPLEGAYFSYWSGVPMQGFELYSGEGRGVFGAPTNDDLTLIGVGWVMGELPAVRADIEGNYLRTIAELAPGLAERVKTGRREARFVGAAIDNYLRRPYGPGWALVGDAGYKKDPCTAAGISDAFRDAELLAEAVDAGFSGRHELDAALVAYEQHRNAAALPVYEFTCQSAVMQMSPEEHQLIAALQGNQRDTDRFFGALAQTVSVPEFFAPENIDRILAAGRAREPAPA